KNKAKDILNQYNYLEIEMQLCYPHYLSVVEPDHHKKNKSSTNSTYITESSNHKNNDALPTNNTPDIVVPKLLSFAGIRNKFVNSYSLEIGLYLAASGASCDAIDMMHKAGLSVCYKTVENYRKKLANMHSKNIQEYFADKSKPYNHTNTLAYDSLENIIQQACVL
ncbi:6142_t:CDS:2, partial [Racocetra persica]